MAHLKSGLTERTIKSMQLNAGVIASALPTDGELGEEQIIGATRGGGSLSIVGTIRQAAVDGAPVYTKGLERIDEYVVTLSMTMIEFTAEAIKRALVGSKVEKDSGQTVITAVSNILEDDYKDVYWIGDLSDGRQVIILIKNAFNTNGFNLSLSDKGEGTYDLSLIGHYDIDDLETAPFAIIIEDKDVTGDMI